MPVKQLEHPDEDEQERRHIAMVVRKLTERGRTPEQRDALRRLFRYGPAPESRDAP
jgi:2-iminoacetate synthase ThiH